MQTVVATSKLIEKRGDIVTTLENRSLLLKKKLRKKGKNHINHSRINLMRVREKIKVEMF